MSELVSVITPNFNTGQYLDDCVDSILAQSYQNWEMILIDDCSTELQDYEKQLKKDPRIKLVKHLVNKGLPASRNTGIEACNGSVIQPLDADDMAAPTMIEHCLEALRKGLGDIIYFDYQEFGTKHAKIRMPEYDFEELTINNHMLCCSMFWKEHWKEVGGYNPEMRDGLEDWEFWINMGKNGHFGYHLHEFLFFYRKRGDSLSDQVRNEKRHWKQYDLIKSFHKEIYG